MNFAAIKARVASLAGVKHTPGPWIADDGDGGMWMIAQDKTGAIIADLTALSDVDSIDDAANAKLIAAAPEAVADRAELVALVDELANTIQRVLKGETQYWPDDLRAALAKVQP